MENSNPTPRDAAVRDHFKGNFSPFYWRYIQNVKPSGAKESKALCPFHDDHDPSLSINHDTGLFKCFGCGASGDIFTFYARKYGLTLPGDFPKVLEGISGDFNIPNSKGAGQLTNPKVAVRYDYKDEGGNLVYQIERLEPKSFRIRRPDGAGWAYNAKGVKVIPYHLPEILNADEILIVEGEKDADTLAKIGFPATTNPFGAGKWPDHFGQYFAGKNAVLIPDNDLPGRAHMTHVAETLKDHAASVKWVDLPDLSEKGDVSDFIAAFSSKEEAAERLAITIEGAAEYQEETTVPPSTEFTIINAADWLELEPPPPDQILEDTFDAGDKVAIIASSKLRKTFFLLQMLLSIAAGRPFLSWHISKPRRILHVQFEIQDHHYHRRVKRMSKATGITSADLGDRFNILNARGLNIAGQDGIEKIGLIAAAINPEIISFDPLYKVATGAENAAEDLKGILNCFDELAKKTGAAILYVHHDTKGNSGDRDVIVNDLNEWT